MLKLFPAAILAIFFAFSFTSCDKSSNTVAHIDKQEFSVEDQMLLGANLLDYIKSDPIKYGILNANAYSVAYDYLNNIFHAAVLTEQIERRVEFEWEILPILDEDAYAFTLPGGKLFISLGFFKFLENESELMALIAHEIYYTDQDLITAELKDEFGGVVLGDIILGNELNMAPIIDYLKSNKFSDSNVLGADMHTLELLCPFNYDVYSLNSLIDRSAAESDKVSWILNRPRTSRDWSQKMQEKTESCGSARGENYKKRYREFKALLPE